MTKTEFIEMITEYAKNEVKEHAEKAEQEIKKENRDLNCYYAQLGAANEAENFYNVIVRAFIQ